MARTSQAKTPVRRSTRIPTKVDAPAEKTSIMKKPRSSKEKLVSKILDFKKQNGHLSYYVELSETSNNVWLRQNEIQNQSVLMDFKNQIKEKIGYAIEEPNPADLSVEQLNIGKFVSDENREEGSSRKKYSRLSKTHALMVLNQQNEVVDEEDEPKERGSKRKTIQGDIKKAANKMSGGGKARKTKAQLLLENEMESRLQREKEREGIDPEAIISSVDDHRGKNCCLSCAANDYRRMLEKGNMKEFKALFDDVEHIPSYTDEDKPNGLGLLGYAVLLGKQEYADFAENHKPKNTLVSRPRIPSKYKVYGENTGHNRGYGYSGSQAFRTVQESRGNRLGDSAFYSEHHSTRTYMNSEENIVNAFIRPYLPYINREEFKDEDRINSLLHHSSVDSLSIYYAINSGNRKLASSIIKEQYENERSNFNLLHSEVLEFDGKQPLSKYTRPQIIKKAFSSNNITPYHCAAIHPSSSYLKELFNSLDAAERLQTDNFGRSVAFYAAVSETDECLKFLIESNFNLSLVDKYKLSPFVQAARYGRHHNVELIIKHLNGGQDSIEVSEATFITVTRNKRTVLHYAAYFGHPETCKVLVDYNAPVDAIENLEKQTALHFAAKNGHLECVRILIEDGKANPEKADKYGRNPLHLASMHGHLGVVKYLLSKGLNADAGDSSNNCPVHYAAAFGHLSVLHLLIEYGQADPSMSNVWKTTACSIANRKGHVAIVKYLLELKKDPVNVNFKDQKGCIMLQTSIAEKVSSRIELEMNLKKVELLLSMNADPNSSDIYGNTSLHTLASVTFFTSLHPVGWRTVYPVRGNFGSVSDNGVTMDDMDGIEYQVELARKLIANGAELNAKNNDNETPLCYAMGNENHYLVAELIELGAEFWIDVNKNGDTFFHYFGKLAAFIDSLPTHMDDDKIVFGRYLKIAKKIWDLLASKITRDMGIEKTANLYNNNGYSAFTLSIKEAIDQQKKRIANEKKMVNVYIKDSNRGYFTFNAEKTSDKIEKSTGLIDVNLNLEFSTFIKLMEKLVKKLKIDVDSVIQLPKDFKKNNPRALKSSYPEWTGYSALHLACQAQCADLIKFILKSGAQPNKKVQIEDSFGSTPLIIAYHLKKEKLDQLHDGKMESIVRMQKKFCVKKPDFSETLKKSIRILLNSKACPYITNAKGVSPLYLACANLDKEAITLMCKNKPSSGASINSKDSMGLTPLVVAVDAFLVLKKEEQPLKIEVFRSLLQAGADPNVRDSCEDTVFMKVVKSSITTFLKPFLENLPLPIIHDNFNCTRETALIIACKLENAEILSAYLKILQEDASATTFNVNHFDLSGNTPLSYACKNGYFEAIQDLLSLGANPNHFKPQSIPLINAVRKNKLEIVKILIDSGAKINVCDENNNSPLHVAAEVENSRIVDILLNASADVNACNDKMQTPLHIALEKTKKQTNRSLRSERILLKAGANLNAVDFLGRTPLHYAFIDSNIIPITKESMSLSKKAKQVQEDLETTKSKKLKISHFVDSFLLFDSSDQDKQTFNIWMKKAETISIEKEISEAHRKNKKERVIIFEDEPLLNKLNNCIWENESEAPTRLDPVDIVKYLLGFKNIQNDIKDKFGRTPLHYAACVGAFSSSDLLISSGVNLNSLDSDNNGALELALRNSFVDYSAMLCNKGADIKKELVLKNGESKSVLGFSYEKSLINIAYIIMDRGTPLIDSIKDGLENGKFHMVEVILQTSDDAVISKASTEDGKNMWHIVADFKPFDKEMWEEYLPDFIAKLTSLSIPIVKDALGRTPLHYASKHGQESLLKKLIEMSNFSSNSYDLEGISELDYAVMSRNCNCAKALLDSGAKPIKHIKSKEKSSLLVSVLNKDFDIATLLLQNGSDTDDRDTDNGFSNSVMATCLDRDLKMMNLLAKFKADLNKPSMVEKKDENNKVHNILVHPIFIAVDKNDDFLKAFLNAGASPNTYYPEFGTDSRKSCFIYCAQKNDIQMLELLLNHKLNINDANQHNPRTIFYEIYFTRMLKDTHVYSKKKQPKFEIPESIYKKVMNSHEPNVNMVDSITGMTPIELAIIQKNYVVIERLLKLGAHINIESCENCLKSSINDIFNPSRNKLPAFLHGLLQSDMKIIETVCKSSLETINWLWTDIEGNSIVSYLTGVLTNFIPANTKKILSYIKSQMKIADFRSLLRMKNRHGLSPILSALQKKDRGLLDTLLEFDPSLKEYAKESQRLIGDDMLLDSASMNIEFISMEEVEKYAQIERENLQKQKDLEDLKNGKETKIEVEEFKIDEYAKLSDVAEVVVDESNLVPLNVTLMKVELRSWGSETDTSIYKLAVYLNKVLNVYILWTRWGPLGHEGQHQKTPFLTKEEAIAEFRSIFKAKTGNSWETHTTSFVFKLGRYDIMKKAPHPKDTIIENFDFMSTNVKSSLDTDVLNATQLICNYNYISKIYKETNVEMPLGQMSHKQILQAKQLLNDTFELINTYNELKSCYTDKEKLAESRVYSAKIAEKCKEYSRILPKNGDSNKAVRSLYNYDNSAINKELSFVDDLNYVGFAANVILAAKYHSDRINPFDYAFRSLDCRLRSIPKSINSHEYQLVKRYMDSTSDLDHEIVHFFSVDRADESIRYRPFENDPNRKLLWHGSRIGNIMGILKQGLRITPGTAGHNGSLLGSGIYFADLFKKSIHYSNDYFGDEKSSYKVMFLCEVALGTNCGLFMNETLENCERYDSVKGLGNIIPNPDNEICDSNGVNIPMGPCIPSNPEKLAGKPVSLLLSHNEYTVYNKDRVKIRYLLIIKEKNKCELCHKNVSDVKPLWEHEIENYKWDKFNIYESKIVQAYLIHKNKTPQDIYNEELDSFIKEKEYEKHWEVPFSISRNSKVCKSCPVQITTNLLGKRIKNNYESFKALDYVNSRPNCIYGKECRTQKHNSEHRAKYNHWFNENTADNIKECLESSVTAVITKDIDMDEDEELEGDSNSSIEETSDENMDVDSNDEMDTDLDEEN